MRPEFEALGVTYVLGKTPTAIEKIFRMLLRRPGRKYLPERIDLQTLINTREFDLLYFNTITHGDLLAVTSTGTVPVLTHVHELAHSIRTFARGQEALVLARSMAVLAVSNAVSLHLAKVLHCPTEKLHRIYGFVPTKNKPSANPPTLHAELFGPLGFARNDIVIGLCGTADFRKGVDLLVPLALQLPTFIGGRAIRFVWIGSHSREYPPEMATADITQAGLTGRVHFIGPTTRPVDWISRFDLHLLLAREDPFPLVVLEAAALGIPTVCFDGAGGAVEFVRGDAGAIAPYLDLAAMAACVLQLLDNEAKLKAAGATAKARVCAEHDVSVAVPRIFELMKTVVETRRTTG